ncbi:MAG: Acetoin utilization protein, putative [Archaeoglobus fulgidus]|jgi:acetoin utilization deacetylase AcuC-like enzyme|nr:histone deacetylase [Archaeoglobus fulgidus]AIG98165.1 Deacetylase [Archaeoglobus fulgidus DSM 8774]KUJ92911.1 MAG: Acetoin utilization protein, putative [Archaeoglobus fulgidus]KUK06390.1 MAG: Acetoin utilization protein, putative [Archaeoglobus fulgidus]
MFTGVFYHPSFSRRSYLTLGTRLRDFPEAFAEIESPKLKIIESPAVDEELILKIHTKEHLEGVKKDPLCSTAWHSAGGVVRAAEMVYCEELKNAFCYIGAGGHHAGRDYFWGYCCFNDVVLAIQNLYDKFGELRVAIIDTDAHHGDGTRELIELNDFKALHFCICDRDYVSEDGLKIDVSYFTHSYRDAVEMFCDQAKNFNPDILFWYFGHDTHVGDYGDIGLKVRDYREIAVKIKQLAEEICNGKLVVVLGGGSIPEIARSSTLTVIRVLLE